MTIEINLPKGYPHSDSFVTRWVGEMHFPHANVESILVQRLRQPHEKARVVIAGATEEELFIFAPDTKTAQEMESYVADKLHELGDDIEDDLPF